MVQDQEVTFPFDQEVEQVDLPSFSFSTTFASIFLITQILDHLFESLLIQGYIRGLTYFHVFLISYCEQIEHFELIILDHKILYSVSS